MTIDPALLAAVIAAPDDDLIRLQVADWLDEHGQPERAEFIRVQCRLAQITPRRCTCDGGWAKAGEPECPSYEFDRLQGREWELLTDPRHYVNWVPLFMHQGPGAGIRCRSGADVDLIGLGFSFVTFRRGFVAEITCTWADWTAHADAILAACPIRRVNRAKPRTCPYCSGEGCATHGHGDWTRKCDGSGELPPTEADWRGDGLVRVTDEPVPAENNFRPGRWAWIHESIPWARPDGPHLTSLPAAVFDNLVGGPGSVPLYKWYDSPGAAVEDFRTAREKTWPGVRFEPEDGVSRRVREYTEGLSRYCVALGGRSTLFYLPVLRAETDP